MTASAAQRTAIVVRRRMAFCIRTCFQ
jgi:hypothetical protein